MISHLGIEPMAFNIWAIHEAVKICVKEWELIQ